VGPAETAQSAGPNTQPRRSRLGQVPDDTTTANATSQVPCLRINIAPAFGPLGYWVLLAKGPRVRARASASGPQTCGWRAPSVSAALRGVAFLPTTQAQLFDASPTLDPR